MPVRPKTAHLASIAAIAVLALVAARMVDAQSPSQSSAPNSFADGAAFTATGGREETTGGRANDRNLIVSSTTGGREETTGGRAETTGGRADDRNPDVSSTTGGRDETTGGRVQPASTVAPATCDPLPPSHPKLRRFVPHEMTFGRHPTPQAVHLGYPTEDPSSSMSFVWMTDAHTLASHVEIRLPTAAQTLTFAGQSFTYDDLEKDPLRRMHEVHVCALPAATNFEYRVGGEGHWSPWHATRTSVPAGDDRPYVIVVAGDSRSSTRIFGRIATAIASHRPDAVFFTGDLVGDGRTQSLWDPWFAAGEAMFTTSVFVPVLGNHEYDAVNYFGQFALPGDERNFLLRMGHITWAVFDDDGSPGRVETTVRPRLTELLARLPNDPRLFLFHHRPVYSAAGHGSNRVRHSLLLDLFESAQPDAVFTAHNHNYERSCKIAREACVGPSIPSSEETTPGPVATTPGAPEETTPGTIYITTAGAGANLIPSGKRWFTEVSESTYHYVVLHVQGANVRATVYALDGRIIDAFTFPAPFPRPPRSDSP